MSAYGGSLKNLQDLKGCEEDEERGECAVKVADVTGGRKDTVPRVTLPGSDARRIRTTLSVQTCIQLTRPLHPPNRLSPSTHRRAGAALTLYQSTWAHQSGEPGLFPAPKLMGLYRAPSIST